MTWTCTPAAFAGAWAVATRASGSARARASTGSTTPSSSPGGLISVFDNGSDPPKEKQSRGLLLAPNASSHTVSLVKQLHQPAPHAARLQPGQRPEPAAASGNWLMGYGGLPNFTEYDSSGHVLLDGTLGKSVQRLQHLPLAVERPAHQSPPSVAVQAAGAGGLTVAASWNGATEVASWQVLAGSSATSLAPVATAPRRGFQTSIPLSSVPSYVAVQALSAAGAAIGRSATVKP